jgi:5-(hydroxymethyl)furfural/furfural oxidase
LGGALVTGITFDGHRATGVVARVLGVERAFACRELVLSAGALLTPELLLRHGIGPAADLRALGIEVRTDLPVGRNLQNHAMLQFVTLLKSPDATAAQERAHAHGMFRISPDQAANGRAAVSITSGGATGQHPMARRMANFSILLMKPESRGSITLSGPKLERLIEYRLLDAEADAKRIAFGCAFLLSFLASPRMRTLVRTPRLVTRWDMVGRINAPGRRNEILTAVAGTLAGAAPWLGDGFLNMIGTTMKPGTPITTALAPAVLPAGHHSGTCRMGAREQGGVVDAEGRLHGFANIRVIDASVMPTVPRGNTNLPVLMVAEKMADAVVRTERAGIAA